VLKAGSLMHSPQEWSLVTADAREAMRARHAIRAFLTREAAADSDLEAVEIIVGELVANVIHYAPGAVGIHVAWEDEGAVLIVADRGPGIPAVRRLPDPIAASGRGLYLIQALARQVEIDAVPGNGTRIKVRLPVRRAAIS
jgi:anti-sigma regulatory factor (Ser/Thr protein kinase)